ncbi:MAG: metallophosphoesterase [Chloracidobacterium sp.]|nr:metallophosphoesterase [Chloracidobacterium sp.]
MFRPILASIYVLLCLFTIAAAQTGQTGQNQQSQRAQQAPPADVQRQTALPPEAINEPVRAIKAPRAPLPSEKDSAGVTRFSFIVYGDTRGRRDGFEPQYEHSLVINSELATIKKMEKTPFPVRFVIQTGDGVNNGAIGRQWNASFVDLINRLTQEGGVPYFLAPGNHDVSSAKTQDDPKRQPGLKNYFSANAELIPPEGSPRRLAGYPTFSFGYGNTFFIAFDSDIAADEKQFDWVKSQLEGLDRNRYHNVIVYCHHPAFTSGRHGGPKVEAESAIIRQKYMPLFHRHHVKIYFTGHDHIFEHWVEHYVDEAGEHRLDQIITGGGGAPLYTYTGDPDTRDYIKSYPDQKITLDRIAKAAYEPGDGAYHYVLVTVDGDRFSLEVIGVDWGRDFQPYHSNKADLSDK